MATSFEMILSRVTSVRPPADAQDYLDGRNLAVIIHNIMIQAYRSLTVKESSVEKGRARWGTR